MNGGGYPRQQGSVPRDPHLLARGFVKTVEHLERGQAPLLGFAARMSGSEVEIDRAPYLG